MHKYKSGEVWRGFALAVEYIRKQVTCEICKGIFSGGVRKHTLQYISLLHDSPCSSVSISHYEHLLHKLN